MKKKLIKALIISLTVLMALTSCQSTKNNETVRYASSDAWDGSVDTSWYDESGNAFTINSASELAALAALVNSGNTCEGQTFKLGSDINLNDANWTPIGTHDAPFLGNFDGGGKTIYNLRIIYFDEDIAKSIEDYSACFIGLFGCIGGGASIKNLTINNAYLKADAFVGPFVGYIGADETDTDSEVVLENLTLKGDVTVVANSSAGGILGHIYTSKIKLTMKNCTVAPNEGSVFRHALADSEYADTFGGLAGVAASADTTITNSSVSNLKLEGKVAAVGGFTGNIASGAVSASSISNVDLSLDTEFSGYELTIGAYTGSVEADSESGVILFYSGNSVNDLTISTTGETELFNNYIGADIYTEATDNSYAVSGIPSASTADSITVNYLN